jgi:hypothetical protein
MKKKLIIMGIGLAVVGTGMIVKKLRNKKNNEVEETIETEEVIEEMAIDAEVQDNEIIKEENNKAVNEFVKQHPFISLGFVGGILLVACIEQVLILGFGYKFLNLMLVNGVIEGCMIAFERYMPYILALLSVKLLNKLV